MKNYLTVSESDPQATQILEVAWRRYAQLGKRANALEKSSSRGGVWVALLSLVFISTAVIFDAYSYLIPELAEMVVSGLLIVTPILVAILAAFFGRSGSISENKIIRGGAEEILKYIYYYRTVLADTEGRRDWLGGRLVAIQRQISDALNRELSLEPYEQDVPPVLTIDGGENDPGFVILSGDDYVRYRLETKIAWYIQETSSFQGRRTRWILSILLAGLVGTLVAAIGGSLSVWAGMIAAILFVRFGWNELRNLELNMQADKKVIQELINIYDRWNELDTFEKNIDRYIDLIRLTEQTCWFRHSDYIRVVQQTALYLEGEKFINQVVEDKKHEGISLWADVAALGVEREAISSSDYEVDGEILDIDDEQAEYQIESYVGELSNGETLDLGLDHRTTGEYSDVETPIGDSYPNSDAEETVLEPEKHSVEDALVAIGHFQVIEDESNQLENIDVDFGFEFSREEVIAQFKKIAEKYRVSSLNRETPLDEINDVLCQYPPYKLP